MADYVFVGRSRHPPKVGLYQVLTLGIYGRVWMYKLLREFDGHEALFLERRQYLPLLVLPIIGPFFVKRRIAKLVDQTVHHDVTTPPFSPRRAILLGLIPLAPFFHLYVTRVVNHHWRMHTKAEELEIKKKQLEQLARRKSPEAQEQAKVLGKEVAQREKELEDLRSAALAMREADALRRAAEREGGVRRSPLASLKKIGNLNPLRRRRDEAIEDANDDVSDPGPQDAKAPDPGPEEPIVPTPRGRPKKIAEPGPDVLAEEPPSSPKQGFFRRFLVRRGSKEEEAAEDAEKTTTKKSKAKGDDRDAPMGSGPEGLSKDEIKQMRQKAKAERKAAKLAAKEEKRRAKEQRKADKRAAKEARKAAKQKRKDEARKEKEAARAVEETGQGRAKDRTSNKKETRGPKSKKAPAKRK